MTGKFFVDTNVLVYVHDLRQPAKSTVLTDGMPSRAAYTACSNAMHISLFS